MNSHQKTQEYIKGKSPLFYRKIGTNNDIKRLQTSVVYFSYKVSTVVCNATQALLWES